MILEFLRGTGTDNKGRTLYEILQWDENALETEHDYIQWLFPTDIPSKFNPDAPVLTKEDITIIETDEAIRNNIRKALQRMVEFYSTTTTTHWLTPLNHNHLRLTRILRCLYLAKLELEYKMLFCFLFLFCFNTEGLIADETFQYWLKATLPIEP